MNRRSKSGDKKKSEVQGQITKKEVRRDSVDDRGHRVKVMGNGSGRQRIRIM